MATIELSAELQSLDTASFVQHVYLRLLGRAVDADGMKNYTEKLEAGLSRAQIYSALASSEEAQRYASKRATLRTGQQQPVAPIAGWSQQKHPPAIWQASVAAAGAVQAKDAAELFALDGPAFLASAYKTLLDRDIDDDGMHTYSALIRKGWSKQNVVKALADSDEFRKLERDLPGLARVLQNYGRAQRRSWGGWYSRNVLGLESDLPADRERRAILLALTGGTAT